MAVDAEELKLMMEAMNRQREERSKAFPDDQLAKHIDTLKRSYKVLVDGSEKDFQVGSLVVWKDGLKNRKRPQYKEPAIVVQVADGENDALIDPSNDSGSSYYREPLTVQLGLLDEDGELSLYYFDKRRFRPFSL